jgi:predicted transcriptional regulator
MIVQPLAPLHTLKHWTNIDLQTLKKVRKMNATNTVLNRIKQELDLPSDYALAKVLGVGQSCITNYRKNRSNFDDSKAFRAAKLIKLNPRELLARLHKERAKSDDEFYQWDKVERETKLVKSLKKQDVIDAMKAASSGKATPAQMRILGDISEQCILW